jgi:hypothetical protein
MAAPTLFVTVGVVLAFLPWKWHSVVRTPPGVPGRTIVFDCGPPWGTNSARGPASPYPVVGTPCAERSQYRVMTGVDVLLGGIGIVVVVRWARWRVADRAQA